MNAIRDEDLQRGNKPSGLRHADLLREIRESACERRVPAVASALGIDESTARALVTALLG